jgi:hypothetical protein
MHARRPSVDPRKFATGGAFGFREKPEAFIRPDLSADSLHAKARVLQADYVGWIALTVMVLTKEEPPAASVSNQGAPQAGALPVDRRRYYFDAAFCSASVSLNVTATCV